MNINSIRGWYYFGKTWEFHFNLWYILFSIFFFPGKPYPVRNCSLSNQTYTSVEVKCHPGYDGGLPQEFVLEVYHGDLDNLVSLRPLYNVSSKDEPVFVLSGLQASVDAGVHVVIYSVNAKGRSQPIVLSEVTFRDAERRTGEWLIFIFVFHYTIKN